MKTSHRGCLAPIGPTTHTLKKRKGGKKERQFSDAWMTYCLCPFNCFGLGYRMTTNIDYEWAACGCKGEWRTLPWQQAERFRQFIDKEENNTRRLKRDMICLPYNCARYLNWRMFNDSLHTFVFLGWLWFCWLPNFYFILCCVFMSCVCLY